MTAIVYVLIFAAYLAAGIAEQVAEVRKVARMAKTHKEAGYGV